MIRTFFATLWRGFRLIFTLKGLLTASLLGVLVGGMVFAIPKKVREPAYVAPIEASETVTPDASSTPRMAIVFVGLGGEAKGLDGLIARLVSLNTAFTYAISPGTTNSKRHAGLVGTPPAEADLSLPIAFSKGRSWPAPGQITPSMRRRQIGRQVVTDIYSIGHASGIVAGGGYAKGKTDAQMMRIVMAMAKRRNLYFLDTSSNSAAKKLASETEVEYFQPDVTLDSVPTADAVKRQMSIAINKAVALKGRVVVVAHLQPVTVNQMEELIAKVKEANIELTTVSQLNASTQPPPPTTSLPSTSSIVPSTTVPMTGTIAPSSTIPAMPGVPAF